MFVMQNNNITEKQPHAITLENRSKMTLSGVTEVVGFSDSSVDLNTNSGGLNIKGTNLNMSRLNTDTGELNINGNINLIQYNTKHKKSSLIDGLFK